jgi:hypothetical protein
MRFVIFFYSLFNWVGFQLVAPKRVMKVGSQFGAMDTTHTIPTIPSDDTTFFFCVGFRVNFD